MGDKQFLPFISPPSQSPATRPATFPGRQSEPPQPLPRTKSEANVDLQDVLAAAQTAAESAERAATAARSAASLAQLRISELVKKKNDQISDNSSENPFHMVTSQSPTMDNPHLFHQKPQASAAFANAVGCSSAVTDGRIGASPHPTHPLLNSIRIATFSTFSTLDDAIVKGAIKGTFSGLPSAL